MDHAQRKQYGILLQNSWGTNLGSFLLIKICSLKAGVDIHIVQPEAGSGSMIGMGISKSGKIWTKPGPNADPCVIMRWTKNCKITVSKSAYHATPWLEVSEGASTANACTGRCCTFMMSKRLFLKKRHVKPVVFSCYSISRHFPVCVSRINS